MKFSLIGSTRPLISMTSTCPWGTVLLPGDAARAAPATVVSSMPVSNRAVSSLRMDRPPRRFCVDLGAFCSQTRVLIVAGKGGVGKTTVSAALARMAAMHGLSTLIVEVEGKGGLPAVFGHTDPLTYEEMVLSAGGGPGGASDVRARTLTPDSALIEYLEDHGMRRISRRLASSGALDVVATAAPGIKDILVLGKVKQLERSSTADLIVIDAPAAGHAVTFLMSANGLLDEVTVGPIRAQALDVIELLTDPRRCQVMLVTLPEE